MQTWLNIVAKFDTKTDHVKIINIQGPTYLQPQGPDNTIFSHVQYL